MYEEYPMDASAGSDGLGLLMMLGAAFWVIVAVAWLFFGFLQYKISQKTAAADSSWWSFIPLLNIIQMVKMADKPLWWTILMFVPIVNIVMLFLVWIPIAEQCGKSAIWGVFCVLPIFNIVGLLVLAFSENPNGLKRVPVNPVNRPPMPRPDATRQVYGQPK